MAGAVAVREGADGAVLLAVHAQPGARRPGVAGRHGDAVKVRLAAPPERGRANDELCALLAGLVGVRVAQVSVVAGRSSRAKQVRIEGTTADAVRAVLAAALGEP